MRTFSLFITHIGSKTPTLQFEFAPTLASIGLIARSALGRTLNGRYVEVYEDDRLCFTLDANANVQPAG